MIVCKFGGTSVADADAIRRAAAIVRGRVDLRPAVVVSALAGVTNGLLSVAEHATTGQLIAAIRTVESLRERHLQVCADVLGTPSSDVSAEVGSLFDELAALAEALTTLGHTTPRAQDAIAAIGERCAALMVVAAFAREGLNAVHVDARDVIRTDAAFTRAEPLPEPIATAARERVLPLLRDKRIPVMGGFVGATEQGITTTLGRGGGDYSASLLGAALRAERIEIWTDVDGMLTADPRVVPAARLIEKIRFEEASELAYFGAKVLHPSTIAPAVRLGIPVFVFNSRRPDGTGTEITFNAPRRPVTAIAGKAGITLVHVKSSRMLLAHGFMRDIFDVFGRHKVPVDVVSTSEVSVSLTTEGSAHLDDLVHDLRKLGDVSLERQRGIIALVGAELGAASASMARALAAIGDCRVHMLSLSATGTNLTMVIDENAVAEATRRLHAAFFEGNS
jgi:aspartate kinase